MEVSGFGAEGCLFREACVLHIPALEYRNGFHDTYLILTFIYANSQTEKGCTIHLIAFETCLRCHGAAQKRHAWRICQ